MVGTCPPAVPVESGEWRVESLAGRPCLCLMAGEWLCCSRSVRGLSCGGWGTWI